MDLTIPNHWNKLGVPVNFGKFKFESGQFKMITNVSDAYDGKDAAMISITNSPILVIDIDDVNGSTERFERLAQIHGGIENLVYEKTRNNGYHFFFYCEEKSKNILHKSFNGIYIDVIFKGSVFTAPSSWAGKKYEPGMNSILSISSLNQLPALPEWIDDLLCLQD